MTHVDDWLDTPAKDDAEKLAKTFLDKDHAWLAANPLFCTYHGKRYRCIGASRMGDVWLTKHFERTHGYDLRIDVEDCSEWRPAP